MPKSLNANQKLSVQDFIDMGHEESQAEQFFTLQELVVPGKKASLSAYGVATNKGLTKLIERSLPPNGKLTVKSVDWQNARMSFNEIDATAKFNELLLNYETEPMYARAYVTMVTEGPVSEKPDILTVGAFGIDIPETDTVWFDFLDSFVEATELDDGRYQFNLYLKEFDTAYFEEANQEVIEPEWIDLWYGVITEVYYEAGIIRDGKEIPYSNLILESFVLEVRDEHQGINVQLPFTKAQIHEYNEKVRLAGSINGLSQETN